MSYAAGKKDGTLISFAANEIKKSREPLQSKVIRQFCFVIKVQRIFY